MLNRIAVLAIVLASLASARSASAADVKQPPRNVAVVALFDNAFHKLKFGLTVFDNDFQSKDVSAWYVAEQAESDMVALRSTTRVANTQANIGWRARCFADSW